MSIRHQPARQGCASLILFLTLAAPVAAGEMTPFPPASAPVTSVPDMSYEKTPIQLGGAKSPTAQPAQTPVSKTGPMTIIFVFILAVGGGLLALLFAVRKYLPGGRQLFASPAMELLGRTYLDPKRYLCLVRVGKRVLVVGASAEGLKRISEITEEAEVTELLESARPKTEAGLSVFRQLFLRNVQAVQTAETAGEAEREAEKLTARAESLREQVRVSAAVSAISSPAPELPETDEYMARLQHQVRARATRDLEQAHA